MKKLFLIILCSVLTLSVQLNAQQTVPMNPENGSYEDDGTINFDWYLSGTGLTGIRVWTADRQYTTIARNNITRVTLDLLNLGFERGEWINWKPYYVSGTDTTWSTYTWQLQIECQIVEPELLAPVNNRSGEFTSLLCQWTSENCNDNFAQGVRITRSNGVQENHLGSNNRVTINVSTFQTNVWNTWKVYVADGTDTTWSSEQRRFKIEECLPEEPELLSPANDRSGEFSSLLFRWTDAGECNDDFAQGVRITRSNGVQENHLGSNNEVTINLTSFETNTWNSWRVYVADGTDTTWSTEQRRFKIEECLPEEVDLIYPVNNEKGEYSTLTFSWTDEGCNDDFPQGVHITTYRGEQRNHLGSNNQAKIDVSVLEKNVWHFWKVYVANGTDTTWSTAQRRFMIEKCLPTAPMPISPTDSLKTGEDRLLFEWTDEGCNDDYHQGFRITSLDGINTDYQVYGNSLEADISWLNKFEWYAWQVYVADGTDTTWSNEVRYFMRICEVDRPHLISPEAGSVGQAQMTFLWEDVRGDCDITSGVRFTVDGKKWWDVMVDDRNRLTMNFQDSIRIALAGKSVCWTVFITVGDMDTVWAYETWCFKFPPITGVEDFELGNEVLGQNYPNPFESSTIIEFYLSEPGHINLAIYDAYGNEIVILVDGYLSAGNQSVRFDAIGVSSGTYFYRLKTQAGIVSRSMIVLK